MSTAHALRQQIEAVLAHRIPSALSPAPRMVRPVAAVGIAEVDALLHGGLPIGAITELVGPECSGRSSLALAFAAGMTAAGKVCAWVDVSDTLHPESAAANGVDLKRLLWVRCGVQTNNATPSQNRFTLPKQYLAPRPTIKGLHGGGCGGPHPRMEVKGLPEAVGGFLRPKLVAPRCAEPQRRIREDKPPIAPVSLPKSPLVTISRSIPAARVDQALRVTDLLLQGGGFSAIVLDLGSIEPEICSRVPLATWFRYRAAAEKSQTSILLLGRHSCAKSSAGLVLRLDPGDALRDETTVFTGMNYRLQAARERLAPTNVVPMRRPPQRETSVVWQSRTGSR